MLENAAVIFNPRSGALLNALGGDESGVAARLTQLFEARGVRVRLVPFQPDTVRADVAALLADRPECLFVAGGDGTVLAVAQCLHAHAADAVPLGVLPCGTMNVLARDLGIPSKLEDALDALVAGTKANIDLARVNETPFLCSSLVGLFPHLGRLREEGRGRPAWLAWPSLLLRSWRMVKRFPHLRVTLDMDGVRKVVKTRALAISNNPFAGDASLMPGRDRLDSGRLAIYAVLDRSLWELAKLVFSLAAHRWPSRKRLASFEASAVSIEFEHLGIISVMSDGETQQLSTPLRYDMLAQGLAVLRP